jgi:hypothetical protein
MKRILLMLTLCVTIVCASTERTLARQIPPTARAIEAFRRIKPHMSMERIMEICGVPDEDIGSGIHIYVYKLSDGSLVRIGTPDKKRLVYVVHVLPNGEARSIIKIPGGKDKHKRHVPSTRRPTTRSTRRLAGILFTVLPRVVDRMAAPGAGQLGRRPASCNVRRVR